MIIYCFFIVTVENVLQWVLGSYFFAYPHGDIHYISSKIGWFSVLFSVMNNALAKYYSMKYYLNC